MASFKKNQSIRDFQYFVGKVYGLPNDQSYQTLDLLSQLQRFTTRALKGIRKGDGKKIKTNLLITISWLMSIANRFHIDVEDSAWQRFPALCSYCGKKPCACKKMKSKHRQKVKVNLINKPKTLDGFQKMFGEIYPTKNRTLLGAGIHLAEEMGEVSEAIHNFLGQHKNNQLNIIKSELSDYISCFFGVANSTNIKLANELEKKYSNNCHVCHKIPCVCNFSTVSKLKT